MDFKKWTFGNRYKWFIANNNNGRFGWIRKNINLLIKKI